jgi:hypothetical protein
VYQKDGYHNKRADEEIEATGSQKQANRKIALAREAAKREARFVHDPTTIRSPSETQDPRPEIRDPLPKTQDPEGSNGSDIDLSQSGEISLERRTVRAVTAVFDHWRKVWKHPKAVLDPKRKKAIAAQLRRYSADDLCKAISGYLKSEHHTGKNDRNTVYDDIGLLLRDAAHIDAGIQLADAPPPCRRHTSAELEVRERIRQTLQARSNNISDPELAEESRASIEEVRYWRPQLSATETEQRH